MLKYSVILPLFSISSYMNAQFQNEQFIHKHLVRADASIVSGYMFKDNLKNVHLNGNLEYYLDNIVSIRGDGNYLLGSTGWTDDSMHLKDDISIMLGPVFHFRTNNHFDPYFILQPGIAYTSSYYDAYPGQNYIEGEKKIYNYQGSLSPMASAGLGFNYYFQRFAHLFLETRYVHGQHLSFAPSPVSLQELRITFGLGFNLFIIKEKKKPV
jgi:hypothetical protein